MDQKSHKIKPKLICITPVKNEAWCLDVFLMSTSQWADHIIIADQNSTDESREIATKYPKVKLIINTSESYDEGERQKLLINEARKIDGEKIIVALDADEVFTANFEETNDWQYIMNSKPGEVFGFQWANITPDKNHCFISDFYFPWLFHDDGITEHKNYVRYIHSMRIPYPKSADEGYYYINDFKVFHFAWINQKRVESKNRFYQCLVHLREPNEHFISLFRTYHQKREKIIPIPNKWIDNYRKLNRTIIDQLNLSDSLFWYDEYLMDIFQKFGYERFKYLNIWNKGWIDEMKRNIEILDPRSKLIKIIHAYLWFSQKYFNTIPIKIVDNALKKLLK